MGVPCGQNFTLKEHRQNGENFLAALTTIYGEICTKNCNPADERLFKWPPNAPNIKSFMYGVLNLFIVKSA